MRAALVSLAAVLAVGLPACAQERGEGSETAWVCSALRLRLTSPGAGWHLRGTDAAAVLHHESGLGLWVDRCDIGLAHDAELRRRLACLERDHLRRTGYHDVAEPEALDFQGVPAIRTAAVEASTGRRLERWYVGTGRADGLLLTVVADAATFEALANERAAALAAVRLLAPHERPGRTLRDTWTELFQGSRKLGWAHDRLEEHADAGPRFTLTTRSWVLHEEGANEALDHTEADAGGRVMSQERIEWTRFGWRAAIAERRGERLEWRVRDQDVRTGGTAEDVRSPEVVALLLARGDLARERVHSYPALDLVQERVEAATFSAQDDGDGAAVAWRRVGGVVTRQLLARSGALLGGDGGLLGGAVVPATEAEARDLTRSGPSSAGVPELSGDTFELECGARLVAAPGWCFRRLAAADAVQVVHVDGAAVVVLPGPATIPADPVVRRRIAGRLVERLRRRGLEVDDEPRLLDVQGWPAIELTSHDRSTHTRSLLVACGEASLSVTTSCRLPLREALGPAIDRALAGLRLPQRPAPPAGPRRVTVADARLTLELPAGWTALGGTANSFVSPDLQATVSVRRVAAADPDAEGAFVAAVTASVLSRLTDPVWREEPHDVTAAGIPGLRWAVEGVRQRSTDRVRVRYVFLALPRGEDTVLVTGGIHETGGGLEVLEPILASARWEDEGR